MDSGQGLTAEQQDILGAWLPDHRVLADHSWGLVGTTVLQIEHAGTRYIAKAGDANDRHIAREIHAHQHWLAPWNVRDRAPRLVHAMVEAKLLLCTYLEGHLVEGADEEWLTETYIRAGRLLALLHDQDASADDAWEAEQDAKALRWLDGQHNIEPDVAQGLRSLIGAWPKEPVVLVPTHGDWQPRNWLTHAGQLYAIDFGRAERRPAFTDLARLHARQFRAQQTLETAFLLGYGSDPRQAGPWRRLLVREAIGTACWAAQVGDKDFEAEGLRMIGEALSGYHE